MVVELLDIRFKIFYILPDSVDGSIAQHAHNDGLELLGEVGILGISDNNFIIYRLF